MRNFIPQSVSPDDLANKKGWLNTYLHLDIPALETVIIMILAFVSEWALAFFLIIIVVFIMLVYALMAHPSGSFNVDSLTIAQKAHLHLLPPPPPPPVDKQDYIPSIPPAPVTMTPPPVTVGEAVADKGHQDFVLSDDGAMIEKDYTSKNKGSYVLEIDLSTALLKQLQIADATQAQLERTSNTKFSDVVREDTPAGTVLKIQYRQDMPPQDEFTFGGKRIEVFYSAK